MLRRCYVHRTRGIGCRVLGQILGLWGFHLVNDTYEMILSYRSLLFSNGGGFIERVYWDVEIEGCVAGTAPHEIQVAAFEAGAIPYIPDHHN